ncbi:MAG: hypothetical protein IJF74_04980 [Clostridia bacterium]|nr:hypothetical protein [Clostridia bacterium]
MMFDVLSVQNKEEQKNYAALCGTEYLPAALAYSLTVDSVFAGLCQFNIGAGYGEIASLDAVPSFEGNADGTRDAYLAALCRTSLSFLELIGIKEAYYTGAEKSRALMLMSGFKETDGKWKTDLKELFAHCPSEGK